MNILSRLFFRTLLQFSLIVLFGFFFSQGASIISATAPKSVTFTDASPTAVLSEPLYISAHKPLHLPFESKLKIEEYEETEDTKPKDTFKNFAKKYIAHHHFETVGYSALDKSLLAHLRLAYYNRSTISLITLHHTWKIFLI